tara:strand:+ start:7514 stop:8758 length:1245 start_codon:yes stop_codon:yes gene_type:complete
MLNFSKNFVTYLDNYDKNRQHTYENNLLVNVETEFLTNFKLEKTNTLYFPVLPPEHNNDISYNAQNDTLKGVFDILKNNSLFDKDISPQLSPQNKKKFEIKEHIESIDDLINIIDTYNNFNEYEYNIDVRLLKKIKPELVSLNDMIGIKKLKQNVLDQLLYFIQNLHISDEGGDYKHTVIYGPPGTGKTEIAKIIGTMYSKIGVLSENKFMKVSRQDLIAGYLGQTAIKTAKVVQKALGGVLFIDEAYSLASTEKEDSFSKECLDTLCESLSNHKGELMVIIAGYEQELDGTFFRVNQGLNSRFIWRFTMEPYESDELIDIFKKIVENNNWKLGEDTDIDVEWFKKNYKDFSSYGRDMEQLFTYTKISHSRRVYGKDPSIRKKINMDDIKKGFEVFLENRKKKEHNKHLYSMYI